MTSVRCFPLIILFFFSLPLVSANAGNSHYSRRPKKASCSDAKVVEKSNAIIAQVTDFDHEQKALNISHNYLRKAWQQLARVKAPKVNPAMDSDLVSLANNITVEIQTKHHRRNKRCNALRHLRVSLRILKRNKIDPPPTVGANLIASASSIDFGPIAIGASETQTVTITNQGPEPATRLVLEGVPLPFTNDRGLSEVLGSCYEFELFSRELDAGASCSIQIRLQPESAGSFSSTQILTFTDSQGSKSVSFDVLGSAQ